MGRVNITLANGRLGSTLQTNDGIAGMVLTGTAVAGHYSTETPILITGVADLVDYGIDSSNNAFAIRQITDYYTEAGVGAELYLMLVKNNATIDLIADPTNNNGARKLLDFANGRIKLLGIMTDDTVVTNTVTDGMNGAVYVAEQKMNTLADEYFKAQRPFRAIVGGTSYDDAPGDLIDMTAGTTNNRTAILIGDTTFGAAACLGLLLGRMSSIPVMRKVSRVRTGPMSNTEAYIGSASIDAAINASTVIAARGYITWCTYPNVSGFFFSGDDTCSATTDDYHFLSRGRVIDKAHVLAYSTFVQEVDDEVPVNDDGTLDAGFCKWLSQQIENQVNNSMTVNKEISGVSCIIDPAQNILSTNVLNVSLQIIPVGYATNIDITLGFDNPAL